MDLAKREKMFLMLKKELKENYETQKRLGIVGGARTKFLNYTQKILDDLDNQSQKTTDKDKFEIIKNQKVRIKKYRNDNFFFF